MGFCADIFNQHVDWALKERTWNKNKAHKDLWVGQLTSPSIYGYENSHIDLQTRISTSVQKKPLNTGLNGNL